MDVIKRKKNLSIKKTVPLVGKFLRTASIWWENKRISQTKMLNKQEKKGIKEKQITVYRYPYITQVKPSKMWSCDSHGEKSTKSNRKHEKPVMEC